SPVCAPSRCCLMTGKHAGHAWVRDNRDARPKVEGEFPGQVPLPEGEVTVAELLKRQRHATAGDGKSGRGAEGPEAYPLRPGSHPFYGYRCQWHAHNPVPTYLLRDGKRVELEGNDGGAAGKQYSHDLFEAEALKFVRANKGRPFFLY